MCLQKLTPHKSSKLHRNYSFAREVVKKSFHVSNLSKGFASYNLRGYGTQQSKDEKWITSQASYGKYTVICPHAQYAWAWKPDTHVENPATNCYTHILLELPQFRCKSITLRNPSAFDTHRSLNTAVVGLHFQGGIFIKFIRKNTVLQMFKNCLVHLLHRQCPIHHTASILIFYNTVT